MKKIVLGLLLAFAMNVHAEDAPPSVQKIVPAIEAWGNNSALITAVKAQNAEHLTMDVIKARDEKWMTTAGVDDFMKSLLGNSAAAELKKLAATAPYYTELFLMDNQGANVAMTNKTSDYWQGDEAKFKESYKGGVGAVHIGKVKFDTSAQAYLVQVSVPVKDSGHVIGALTVGINVDNLEAPGK